MPPTTPSTRTAKSQSRTRLRRAQVREEALPVWAALSPATVAYDSKNVLGTNGSTLGVTDYTIIGSDGLNASGNYNVSTTTAAGTITPKSLT